MKSLSGSIARAVFIDVATVGRLDIDPETVKRVERRIEEIARTDRRLIVIIAIGATTMVALGFAIGSCLLWLGNALDVPRTAGIIISAVGTPATLIALWFSILPRVMRRHVRRTLRECGVDLCSRCGYLREGIEPETRCPECGVVEPIALGDRDGESG